MYFDLGPQERSSFLDVCRHTVLEGPLSLVRFSDSGRGHQGGHGTFDSRTGLWKGYWMYASEVGEMLDAVATNGPYGLRVVREISERWAVCDDWGDLQRAWVMDIPAGGTLDAWFGLAKFQPRTSTQAQRSSGKSSANSYGGGSLQLIVGLRRHQRRWIRDPIPTLGLSKKKLLERER